MRFSDIPGQEEVKLTLRRTADSGRIPHALMFSGPSGSGKMLLARTFAQYIHCTGHRDGEPCGVCRNCRLHEDLDHPDLHFIYPVVKGTPSYKPWVSADYSEQWKRMLREYPAMPEEKWPVILEAGTKTPAIYVDEANAVVLSDSYPPYASDHKIFLIWLPEKMNPETANKLLKVLEEPAPGTLFILVSNNDLQLLPTIFSRVRRIPVGRLSDLETERYLVSRHHLPEAEARSLAPLCNGSLWRADEAGSHSGENGEFLALYQNIMRSAYSKHVARLKTLAEKTAAFNRGKTDRFLTYMGRMARENFIYNLHEPRLTALTPEEEAFSKRFSPFVNHLNIEDFALQTDLARRDLAQNANPKLVLFDYFIHCIILLNRKPPKN